VRQITLGLVCALALPLSGVERTKPLVENATVERDTAVFAIRQIDDGGNTAVFEAETGKEVRGTVCSTTAAPPVTFDNMTRRNWRIRVIPGRPDPSTAASCHTLRCARSLDDLQRNGLCDRWTETVAGVSAGRAGEVAASIYPRGGQRNDSRLYADG
jgi:hypothetical protein